MAKKLLNLIKRSPPTGAPSVLKLPQKTTLRREKHSKKNGRWMIVLIFLATVTLSLFFYLKTEIPLLWDRWTGPVVISSIPKGAISPFSAMVEEFEGLTGPLRGDYGFYVYRLDSGESYGIREDEIFTAASLIKLPVMLAVYQQAEGGSLDLGNYRQNLEAMGQRSDNSAFNRTVKALGEEKVQMTIDNLGMINTSFTKNETSPADVGLFFQRLYQDQLISKEHQEEFLSFLTGTTHEDRIPAGVPKGVRVAHKIGTEVGVFTDAGIVFNDSPFVLVIMSENARESEAVQAMVNFTRVVWEFENSN